MTVAIPQSAAAGRRQRIAVQGQVQGVGFRPFVYRLAKELGLSGWVRNCGEGVEIEIQGSVPLLQRFFTRLHSEAPSSARIAACGQTLVPVVPSSPAFFIAPSLEGEVRTTVAADAALCPDCLRELFDSGDRRYRYPFIACVHCGPRFTLVRTLPFDRHHTSMAEFVLCPACAREADTPDDRRFHDQANACPACGPQLNFHDGEGAIVPAVDPVATALAALLAGGVIALKGVGGFHLVCDARDAAVVARLRERKGREAKPFAVMAANIASLSQWVRCGEEQRQYLESPAHPIVLLEKTAECDAGLDGVAPWLSEIGVMLPYTPLHYLLFHEAAGRPDGTAWLRQAQALILVCTSANPDSEPLVMDNSEAFERLHGIADGFVTHDRDITQRCDDSVMRVRDGAPHFIRRARGFVPQPIKLPRAGPSVLALGGDLKNTFCLTRDNEAFVSQHNGDLHAGAARRVLEETLGQWLAMLDIVPQYVAHDGHPDFFTTHLAQRLATERDLPCMAVQHHHAHISAVTAEHGVTGPVLGVALDGFGLGDDGGIWGGELLWMEGPRFQRVGKLLDLALPGGDRAAREPWRVAASALHALGRGEEIPQRFPYPAAKAVMAMLDKGINAPLTSSAGRWFDAAAGLLGIAARNLYEGQAAMELEALAKQHGPLTPRREDYRIEEDDGLSGGILNLLPLIHRLAQEQDAPYGAALFHVTLVAALSEWIRSTAQYLSLCDVVLSGGCFINEIMRRDLCAELRAAGMKVHIGRQVPPNDGGLSLGQAWVVMQQRTEKHDVLGYSRIDH